MPLCWSQDDSRRLFQLLKSTSSAAHPFHKFSTGNLQTLSQDDGAQDGATAGQQQKAAAEAPAAAEAMAAAMAEAPHEAVRRCRIAIRLRSDGTSDCDLSPT